jgi:glycosyltransferase involved in cell wall biosynthesis
VTRPPTVTVVLPAYNAATWLAPAIESILGQCFRDFELIVLDDGSVDGTRAVLAQYADARLRVIHHETNRGLISSLNEGIDAAHGKYIARMDADDVAHPKRLQLQVAYLDSHARVGICGTWFRTHHGTRRASVRPPIDHDEISAHLFFRSPFGHPTVMMRRQVLQESGLRYDPKAVHAEDFDLWVRARPYTCFANLPRFLLQYRAHPQQVSSGHLNAQKTSAQRILLSQLESLIPSATAQERGIHLCICDDQYSFSSEKDLDMAGAWLGLLRQQNEEAGLFERASFQNALETVWYGCCVRATISPRARLGSYVRRRYTVNRRARLRNRAVLTYRTIGAAPDS